MGKIIIQNQKIGKYNTTNYEDIVAIITKNTSLIPNEFYLEQNGKRLLPRGEPIDVHSNVYCQLRVCGGKGGFGSMLRAIGAQIEKTTNREACRDLSGRRLRDINEEKRLKAWLEKQGEREREAEERKKRKIEKLLAVPKHDFKDEEYEQARSKLTEKVNDAVEEGFKKAHSSFKEPAKLAVKRKAQTAKDIKDNKKKNSTLWIGDDISDSGDDTSDNEDDSIRSAISSADENKKLRQVKEIDLLPDECENITIPSKALAAMAKGAE